MAIQEIQTVTIEKRESAVEVIKRYQAGKINIKGSGYDHVRAAFEYFWKMVEPGGYWKDPIGAWILTDDFEYVAGSVEFFTGTELTKSYKEVTPAPWAGARMMHVEALGYQAGPCGDH
jgi:hypothetical protein